MLSWIGPLLGLLPSALTTINGITTAISNEKIAVTNATTEKERIAAQERVNSLQLQRDVLIADAQKSSLDIYIRSGFGLGALFIFLKILPFDKGVGPFFGCVGNTDNIPGCGIFNTDKIDPNLWYVLMVITGFYFLHSMVKGK